MLLVKNIPTQWWEDWGRKLDKGSINKKPPELNEEMSEENQKIIELCKYCWWKNLLTLTRIGKEKPEDRVEIADERIDKKPSNPLETKEKNRS